MSLLAMLQGAAGGQGLSALAQQLGMDEQTTAKLAEKMAPAISGGMKQRASQQGGMGALLGSLQGEGAAQFADPANAAAPAAKQQGEQFLSEIFGSQDASRELAMAAAAESGATKEQAESLLPSLAAMLQGQMQQQVPDAEIAAAKASIGDAGDKAGAGLGDLMGMLGGASGGAGGILGMAKGLLGGGGSAQAQSGGLGGLMSMLDSDGDGSPINDLTKKFFS